MFKKNVWIVGLLAVLAIMLIGCVEALPPPEGEIVEVTRLSDIIKDAPLGLIKDDDAWSAIFADTPFMKCGPATFEIINDGGVKKLKVYKMINTWGEGLDVRHVPTDSGNSGANYKVGDKITIKGTADPVGIFFNAKGGAYAKIENWRSTEVEFDKTITLTADDVGNIKVGNPQTIRLHYDDGQGDSRRGVIIFEEIVVEGMRSAGDTIELPDFSISNVGDYNVGVLTGAAANEVYLDLSEAVKFGLTPDPKAFTAYVTKTNTTTGELYAKFTANTQGIFIPFTDEVKAKLQAAAKAQYTFSVVIDGSTDKAASHVRWCFGQDTGSGWNISNMIQDNNFANTLKGTLNEFNGIDNMKGVVLQARPDGAGAGTAAIATPYSIRINSIKVALNPPTQPIGYTTDYIQSGIAYQRKFEITIKLPYYGATAPTSIDISGRFPDFSSAANTADRTKDTIKTTAKGAITWTPALSASGKFAKSTAYSATITLSPNTDYFVQTLSTSDFVVSYSDGTAATASYNAFTKEILVVSKDSGAVVAAPPAFTLTTDVKFNALAAGADLKDAANAITAADAIDVTVGTSTPTVVKVDVKDAAGTVTGQANAIQIVWGGSPYGGSSGIWIKDSYFDFEAGDKVKVVLQLKAIVTTSTSNFNVLLKSQPYGWSPINGKTYDVDLSAGAPGSTAYDAAIAAALNKDITFDFTLTASDVANIKGTSQKAIMLALNNVTDTGSTIVVKEISVTGGDRK